MSLYTPYPSGRLADIMDEFYWLADDTKSGSAGTGRFVDQGALLLSIGRGLEDFAKSGYFRTSTTIDIVAEQQEYNLLALIPRLVKADAVRKTDTGDWLWDLEDQSMYAAAKQFASSWETGKIGFLRGTKFYLVDAPTAGATDGLEVHYSFYPPYAITLSQVAVVNAGSGKVTLTATAHELEVGDYVMIYNSTNYSGRKLITAVTADTFTFAATYVAESIGATVTCHCEPRFPITSDVMLTYWCLWQRAMKDKNNAATREALKLYSGLYGVEKDKLIDDGSPPILRARTAR